jgi:hypothetical protein
MAGRGVGAGPGFGAGGAGVAAAALRFPSVITPMAAARRRRKGIVGFFQAERTSK